MNTERKEEEPDHARNNAKAWYEPIVEWHAKLDDDELDEETREKLETEIRESPLSVEIRSDWKAPGSEWEAGEFCILLSTGGPALRIIGDLQSGEPYSARLEYQDWFKPWTAHHEVDDDVLLWFCRFFYYDED